MKWSPPGRRKRGRPKAAWAEGIRGLMGEKGLIEEDWKDRDKLKKKIIVKWAQESQLYVKLKLTYFPKMSQRRKVCVQH